jgi:predicted RNase H-like nuclease
VTAAGSYGELNALSKQVCGRGISRQTCNILAKIVEADACMTPELQQRIVEAHPEVAFWSLNGCVHLEHAKLRPEGLEQRLGLLETVYGASVREMLVPRGASRDDFYDAAVLARTAARLVSGDAEHLPAEPQLDARGLRMEIVY